MVEGVAELGWLEMVGRLGLAALLGGVLGLEREYDGQDAGFRTHLLVVVGATLFALMSVGGFDQFVASRNDTNVSVDVTRIAAYVAPGIGFIGGGAILKYGGKVVGITTAASLWTAAAIGVATGLGAWVAAAATTAIALFALEVLQPVSDRVGRHGRGRRSHLVIEMTEDADVGPVLAELDRFRADHIKRLEFGVGPDDDGRMTVQFWDRPAPGVIADLVACLLEVDGVVQVAAPDSRTRN